MYVYVVITVKKFEYTEEPFRTLSDKILWIFAYKLIIKINSTQSMRLQFIGPGNVEVECCKIFILCFMCMFYVHVCVFVHMCFRS